MNEQDKVSQSVLARLVSDNIAFTSRGSPSFTLDSKYTPITWYYFNFKLTTILLLQTTKLEEQSWRPSMLCAFN